MKYIFVIILIIIIVSQADLFSQVPSVNSAFKIARLKYNGGGDWYNDPQEEVNLLKFIGQNTSINVAPGYEFVSIEDDKFFTYPFIFMTGHGNIVLSDNETHRLRTYLENGGFLYVDDDYGMDKSFRREIKKVFPDRDLVELPHSFGLYSCQFDFSNGPPKVHAHDEKPAQGFGLFHNNRLVLYYTFESNPSDGWNDPEVHNDTMEKHIESLRFGTNIVVWALTH
ncbi:MAG: DUF4159 domain-containing protein [Ignavibacteriales bacterium]|nr:DUF4159 domain-containing protein [Ignavibacteriales bacterium]